MSSAISRLQLPSALVSTLNGMIGTVAQHLEGMVLIIISALQHAMNKPGRDKVWADILLSIIFSPSEP